MEQEKQREIKEKMNDEKTTMTAMETTTMSHNFEYEVSRTSTFNIGFST